MVVCADKPVPRVNPDPAAGAAAEPKASPAAAAAVVCGAVPRPNVLAAAGVPNENPEPPAAGAAAAVLFAGVPKLKEPAGLEAG